jgi:four helix bundle protein
MENTRVRTFQDLIVWQKAHTLTLRIYEATRTFPQEERYGITSQIRRAAYSVPANIVEGHSRKGKKVFQQFLSVAAGSLGELRYFLILSKDLGHLEPKVFETLWQDAEEVGRILFSFTQSLNASRL